MERLEKKEKKQRCKQPAKMKKESFSPQIVRFSISKALRLFGLSDHIHAKGIKRYGEWTYIESGSSSSVTITFFFHTMKHITVWSLTITLVSLFFSF